MHERKTLPEPPTVDRIRADISGERTGEKVDFPDPAAAPLGTDDEASGHAATLQERGMENRARPTPTSSPEPSQGPVLFYFAFSAVLAVVIMAFAYLT
jgi:hypothetical protein